MPTGPLNRVADNSLARKLLSWNPKFSSAKASSAPSTGYYATHDKDEVKRIFTRMLTER